MRNSTSATTTASETVEGASFSLADQPLVRECSEARLLDIGDGVACLEFRSKGNSITPGIKDFLAETLDRHLDDFDGLVIGNQAKNFSVGANLHVMKANLDRRDFAAFEHNVVVFQRLNTRIKYYRKPIVAAPYRHVLGGGLEIALHCHGRVAAPECFMGLVETGVGLIPGGGGTKECALLIGAAPEEKRGNVIRTVFEKLLLRSISKDAQDGRRLLYLKEDDLVAESPEALIPTAKRRCLELVRRGGNIAAPQQVRLSGNAAYLVMMALAEDLLGKGAITPYDFEVGKRIATALSGGGNGAARMSTEEELLTLERESFLDLVHQQGTYERISHFVEHGELLRN